MSRSRREKILLGSAALLVAALVPTFASCATTEEGNAGPDDTKLPPQDGATDGSFTPDAAVVDGGCDASDPSCVTQGLTCAQTDFCPVPTPVSNAYALTAVWGSSKDDVWAVGSGGTIVHYDGAVWKPTPSGVKFTFRAIWGSGPTDVWTVSSSDVILHTNGYANGAATWTPAPPATDQFNSVPVFAIWGKGTTELRMGGTAYNLFEPNGDFGPGNQFYKTVVDGGVGWGGEKGTATVRGIWGATADDIWIVADNSAWVKWQLGYTMHGTRPAANKPFTWTSVDSQSAVTLESVWGSSANDVWAVGDLGTIRHVTAAASRWDVVPSPTTQALHSVWGSAPNDIWAVGDDGAIIHFDGTSWTLSSAAYPVGRKRPNLFGVWGSAANDVWVVGDGIVLHFTGAKKAPGGVP